MISDYYYRQFSQECLNTKTIKLKSNQVVIQPFVIPFTHFNPNKEVYEKLKYKCQKIKTEFSFITNEIQRQLRQKKEKQQESKKLSQALFEKENRLQVQRQMSLTCQKLLKLHQFRKSNFQGLRPKRQLKNKQKKITEIVGLPVTYSPKKILQQTERRKVTTSTKSRFRRSMGDE